MKSLLFANLLLATSFIIPLPSQAIWNCKNSWKNTHEPTPKTTVADKLSFFHKKFQATEYEVLPKTDPNSPLAKSKLIDAVGFLPRVFKNQTDQMETINGNTRPRLIHTHGVVASFKFTPKQQEGASLYSGLFRSGGEGIIRMSLAQGVGEKTFTPGVALKFLIHGDNPSVNIFQMPRKGLDGQGKNSNFFEYDFVNNLDKPRALALKAVAFFFSKTASTVAGVRKTGRHLPLEHMSRIDSTGNITPKDQQRQPYELILSPTVSMSRDLIAEKKDYRIEMQNILKKGTHLFDVYARDRSKNNEYGELIFIIGQITLTSNVSANAYADTTLHFHHNIHGEGD